MVETKVHFVNNKHLVVLTRDHGVVFSIRLAVIDFDACKLRVFKSVVEGTDIHGYCVRFVSFKRARDNELVILISIHLVNELLPLNGSNKQNTTFWISCQVLAGYDPTAPCLAVCLLYYLHETLLFFVEF